MGTPVRTSERMAAAAGQSAGRARVVVARVAANLRRSSAPGARSYEVTFGTVLAGLYAAMADDLRDRLRGVPAARVVDVGAGPGGLVVALAARLPHSRFTIVDIDPAMVAVARQRMAREGLAERVDIVVGDVGALPLADACADVVTSSFSVHHWPDPAAGFAQVHRILRPGGRAVIYDLPDWWGRFETKAPAMAGSAVGGGLAEAHTGRLAWPGPVRVVQRLDAIR